MKIKLTIALFCMTSLAQAAVLDATCQDGRGSFRAEVILRESARGIVVGARGLRDFNRGMAVSLPRLKRRGGQITGSQTIDSSLGYQHETVSMTGTGLQLTLVSRGVAFGQNQLGLSCRFEVARDADDLRALMRELRQE